MPPVTRRQSEHSVIDLTEDDLLPDSPPRPTIASRRMAPRRALRSGSTSTTTSTVTRTSGSRTEDSTAGDGRSTGQLTRSSSGSSIVALEEPPEGMIFPASKRQKLNKGKGRATSEDVLTFDEDDERRLLDGLIAVGSEAVEMEEDGGVIGEPEENLLASFQCPICLAPPIQAVLTPCGHVICGACLFSTLKTQAIRERRPPNPTGMFPTTGPGVKKPRGKADTEAWFERYGADKTGKIRGKILTGSCPVCRHDIEGGFGEPGFGGVVYLEVCTVVSVL